MPKVSPERLLARERGIVQAAARCLQRNGLEGTGMRDLFRAANLSPGAVYRYFPSKEDLLVAVAAAGPTLIEAVLATVDEAATIPEVRLRRLLEACAAGPPPARLQFELETAALRSPRIAAALRQRRAATRRMLAEALDRPGGEPDEPSDLTLAVCEGLARRRLLEPQADLAGGIAAAERLLTASLTQVAS